MSLRKQTSGKQKPWTEKELTTGLNHFFKENNRYPTASEVNKYPYLPSARSIERSHGGLVAIRKKLGLKSQTDFRTGKYSSLRAKNIGKRSRKIEQEVYNLLVKKFGAESIQREYFFTDDRRTRTDFYIHTQKDAFSIDVFYPKDRHNLSGCLNSKMKTYGKDISINCPVIFLMMNNDIDQGEVDNILKNKINKLPAYQKVMTSKTFQEFLKTKKRR